MSDILHDIIAHKRLEMEALRSDKPSLRQALLASETGIIAEFERKSPSKGWIKEDGRADEIPLAYQQAGAAAVSILTDSHYFSGCDDFIRTARLSGVTLPTLYKNFVIDELQLMQAVLCGASAVLLIAACLTAASSSARLTTSAWKCCWRCMARKSSTMPTSVLTFAASTTAIWVRSSPTSRTRSGWPSACRRRR